LRKGDETGGARLLQLVARAQSFPGTAVPCVRVAAAAAAVAREKLSRCFCFSLRVVSGCYPRVRPRFFKTRWNGRCWREIGRGGTPTGVNRTRCQIRPGLNHGGSGPAEHTGIGRGSRPGWDETNEACRGAPFFPVPSMQVCVFRQRAIRPYVRITILSK
jgi:hypothetical protein